MIRRAARGAWLIWFALLIGLSGAMFSIRARLDKAHVALAFLLVVLGGSAAEGSALGVALATTAFLVFNWVFIPPYNTLQIADPLDWLVLFAFLVTGIVAAQLLERQRRAAERANLRASEIDRIATLGAETVNAPRAVDALGAIAAVIRDALATEQCTIHLRGEGNALITVGDPHHDGPGKDPSGLLAYVVEKSEPAAERADGTLALLPQLLNLSSDELVSVLLEDLVALGFPLKVRAITVGALRLSSSVPFSLSRDQQRVLVALSYYAALAVERVRLSDAKEEAESLRRADRLKDALLASISHDLRTPLTAIKGIANEVWRSGDASRAVDIEEEADRLNELVDDLLAYSQINAGVLRTTIQLNTADDVVAAAVQRVEAVAGDNRIRALVANRGKVLAGMFDFAHTVRALTNLLENAVKFSPAGSPVTLEVEEVNGRLMFVVEDVGAGIADADVGKIFEPFYRGAHPADGIRGTGLGLSIARQLIEAQGGALSYARALTGGSRFTIDLPAATAMVD